MKQGIHPDYHFIEVKMTDGTIYATDSTAPIIWRYLPGGEEMDKLVEYPDFVSLQGLVLTNRTLIAADFANGLFAIDLSESSPVVRAFTPPPNATRPDGLSWLRMLSDWPERPGP